MWLFRPNAKHGLLYVSEYSSALLVEDKVEVQEQTFSLELLQTMLRSYKFEHLTCIVGMDLVTCQAFCFTENYDRPVTYSPRLLPVRDYSEYQTIIDSTHQSLSLNGYLQEDVTSEVPEITKVDYVEQQVVVVNAVYEVIKKMVRKHSQQYYIVSEVGALWRHPQVAGNSFVVGGLDSLVYVDQHTVQNLGVSAKKLEVATVTPQALLYERGHLEENMKKSFENDMQKNISSLPHFPQAIFSPVFTKLLVKMFDSKLFISHYQVRSYYEKLLLFLWDEFADISNKV